MARFRTQSVAFTRKVVQAYLAGETLRGLTLRRDLPRNLIRIWIAEHEAGTLNENVQAADLPQENETRRAMLARLVGRQALEIEFLKGGASARTIAQKRDRIRCCRPASLSVRASTRKVGTDFREKGDAAQ